MPFIIFLLLQPFSNLFLLFSSSTQTHDSHTATSARRFWLWMRTWGPCRNPGSSVGVFPSAVWKNPLPAKSGSVSHSEWASIPVRFPVSDVSADSCSLSFICSSEGRDPGKLLHFWQSNTRGLSKVWLRERRISKGKGSSWSLGFTLRWCHQAGGRSMRLWGTWPQDADRKWCWAQRQWRRFPSGPVWSLSPSVFQKWSLFETWYLNIVINSLKGSLFWKR